MSQNYTVHYQYPHLCLLNKETKYRVTHQTTELMRPVGWVVHDSAPPMIGPSQSCSICIRMTTGRLLEYTRSSLLHCGVSDSSGHVYHFDEEGHQCNTWRECVSIPLSTTCINHNNWNEILSHHQTTCSQNKKKSSKNVSIYNDETNNCFHYLVECLQALHLTHSETLSKVEKHYIRPSMVAMETYLQLLERIQTMDAEDETAVCLFQKYIQEQNQAMEFIGDLEE